MKSVHNQRALHQGIEYPPHAMRIIAHLERGAVPRGLAWRVGAVQGVR